MTGEYEFVMCVNCYTVYSRPIHFCLLTSQLSLTCQVSIRLVGAKRIGVFFHLVEKKSNSENNFPPSRIVDLKAVQINRNDPSLGVNISFTAPGDDLDEGQG